jgi:ATP-binding cassette subfamily C protein CydC
MLAVYALLPLAVFDVASASQGVVGAWRRYRASASRLIELQEQTLPTELEFGGGVSLGKLKTVELKHVSLGYPSGSAVVQDFSLKLRAGETAALVGQSGSGKTTIGLALSRLLKPRSGALMLNGRNADGFDSDSIRSRMGYLEQTATIFNSTVRVNLAIAKPSATETQMIAVLSRVGLWSTFEMRNGLDTLVGERGALISGGEAQRLALARALLAEFDLIVLDEPTANVDELQSKRLVSELLDAARSEDRMVLLITHDAKLAKLAEKNFAI